MIDYAMKTLLCIVLISLSFFGFSQEKRVALVIGNSNYQYGGVLRNPVNDAVLIKQVLNLVGFEVVEYYNLDQEGMRRAVDDFAQRLNNFQTGLLFYTGHGIQVKGNNYLIPVDANPMSENEVVDECIKADWVLEKMKGADNETNIIIFDACRNNPFVSNWTNSQQSNGLAVTEAPEGSIIAFSDTPGRTVSDDSDRNGLYTSTLTEYILLNPDLSIEELFNKVNAEVSKLTKGTQIPWESSALTGKFYFHTYKSAGKPERIDLQPGEPEELQADKTYGPDGKKKLGELVSLSGYLSDMQTVYRIGDRWLWENSLHNRLNLELYPLDWLSGSLQVRSRAITGNTIRTFPGYAKDLDDDQGWLDLAFVTDGELGDSAGYVLTSTIDRLWMQFTFGNLEIKAGRQRINWGQTFVWNPNDIFNTYSYFEVDYPERPGSDALRVQYYTGNASTIEMAAKIDSADRVTAAAYFRVNTLGFDIQMLGGIYQEKDLILGTGWSGNLGPTAFRGEMSYFRDLDNFSDTTGYFMASSGFDYTFSNSLSIQVEGLYSAFAKNLDIYNFLQFYSGSLDVKNLGFTEWSFFANLSYPFTPLLNGGFAAIFYPKWKGFYLGPSLDISINGNLGLSLIVQYFSAEFDNPSVNNSRENNTFGFLKFKWSF